MIFTSALQGLLRRFRAPDTAPRGTVRAGRTSYGPPQSEREIRQFVTHLRQTLTDDKLDVIWHPTYKLVQGGTYTATGQLIPPVHEGRWQVIREAPPKDTRAGRGFIVICTVRSYARVSGVLAFMDERDADYAPVDGRLLELLRSADAQNVRQFEEVRRRIEAASDRAEVAEGLINESEAREGLDHAHFKANYGGGVGNWKGRGVDLDARGKIVKP